MNMEIPNMLKLSTGEDSTLGNYRKLSKAIFGEDSGAVKFLDEQIAEAGEDAEVLQEERQMIFLLAKKSGVI